MKRLIDLKGFVCLSVTAAVLMCCSVSRADITNTTLQAYSDGVMTCNFSGLSQIAPQSFQQSVNGVQSAFATGEMWGNILTDTPNDPSLTLLHSINNDTGLTWTDYHLEITLSETFAISNVTVDNGWTSVVTAPTQVGSDWIGYIDYYSGTPILNGGTLNFGYTMTFTGSVSFTEDLTPSTSVPEPTTATCFLLGLGALVCSWRFKQNKQV